MSWKLTIRFETPVHHGSGLGIAGIIDRAFLRSPDGLPFLSGAAIKGKFRHAVSLILDTDSSCRQGVREGDSKGARRFCRHRPGCSLCRIFGSPRFPAALVFEDAFPAPDLIDLLREQAGRNSGPHLSGPSALRHSVAMNRFTRTAERRHLFSSETILPAVTFQSSIRGQLDPSDRILIPQAALYLNHFGGDSARGLGFCAYSVETLP